MQQNRILYITVRADIGGGPVYIQNLIKHLNPDWEIYLACPKDEPYYYTWKQNCKVKKIFVLQHRKFSFIKLYQLYKFIKKNEISIIQSNGKGAGIYGRLLKLIHPKIKIIHVFHGVHISQLNFIKKNIYLFIEKILSKNFSDLLINVSKGEQENCLKHKLYHKNKSIVIYNGVEKLKSYNNPFYNKSNIFRVVTLSRFDYAKNMELAFEIANKLKHNKEIEFIWVGDGEGKNNLEIQSKKKNVNIQFTGFVSNDKIVDYLSNANLYLSTSRWEGLPIALLESISVGLPITATNVVGNNEVVVDNYNGTLFDIENVQSAVLQIDYLSKNHVFMEKLSENAIKLYETNFTIKKMIEKHEKAYKNILKQ